MTEFTIYPAIDLRGGKVVRLAQGDPKREKIYSDDPLETARRWKGSGASWLHVVNLDGAFGEDTSANEIALAGIAHMHCLKTSDRACAAFLRLRPKPESG